MNKAIEVLKDFVRAMKEANCYPKPIEALSQAIQWGEALQSAEEDLAIISQAYCTKKNENKVLDSDLLSAIQKIIAPIVAKLKDDLEQERVRLAGCLCIAEGHIDETVKQGVYGWSLPYERIKELRQENAKLKKEIENLRNYCTLTFGESHPEIKKCLHEIEVAKLRELLSEIVEDIKDEIASRPKHANIGKKGILKRLEAIAKGKE